MPQPRRLRSVKDEDFWTTDSGGYSPDAFYVSSRNQHDHSEKVQVKIPPDVYVRLMEVANSAQFPHYRTPQDVIRDAIVHRMHYLATEYASDPEMERYVQMMVWQASIDSEQLWLDAMNETVKKLGGLLEAAYQGRDWSVLRKALDKAENEAENMPEPYRSQVERLVQEYEARLPRD